MKILGIPIALSKSQRRLFHGTLLALTASLLVSGIFLLGGFNTLEWQIDDAKTKLIRGDSKANPDVVVLLVDEASLSTLEPIVGRWPWPRSVWADVLEFMTMGGAQSVAFDILFTERALNEQKAQSEHDLAFIDSTAESGIATHAIQLLHDPSNPTPNRPLPQVFKERFAIPKTIGLKQSQNNTRYIPFTGLYENARNIGVVEFSPDADGVYRRTRLFRDFMGDFYPVLSVAPLVDILGINRVEQTSKPPMIQFGGLEVPLDRNGFYEVNFYKHFTTYSIGSVLASIDQLRKGNLEALYTDPRLLSPEKFANKIVFIGTSAVGLEDMKTTPLESRWPGVFLHASITSNLLNQEFVYQVPASWVLVLIFLLAIITMRLAIYQDAILLQTFYPFLLASIVVMSGIWAQASFAQNWDLTPLLTSILTTWLMISGYLSATEGREKRRVRNMLSQYVSPSALNIVLDNYQDQIQAEVGKEEEMTVVFSDIRGFTTISESLSPGEVVTLLNIHLDAMTQVTFDFKGTMDKFIGDATMAFWGAPLPDPDHALHATRAMIHMARKVDQVNQTLTEKGLPNIQIGVGGNTGSVILGNIGSSQKLDYTVIGDAVNLGSRLEGLTKQYGLKMLISEFTQKEIYQQIPCALIDQVKVKGKNKPVKIYLPLADVEDPDIDKAFKIADTCQQAFDAYHAKNFLLANQIFQQLPDDPFTHFKALYDQRCQAYLKTPPPDKWDGVFTLTTK